MKAATALARISHRKSFTVYEVKKANTVLVNNFNKYVHNFWNTTLKSYMQLTVY